jgi:hypothetical protein
MVMSPIDAADIITLDIPPRLLGNGTHKLVLKEVDEPAANDDEIHSVITFAPQARASMACTIFDEVQV